MNRFVNKPVLHKVKPLLCWYKLDIMIAKLRHRRYNFYTFKISQRQVNFKRKFKIINKILRWYEYATI